MGKVHALTFVFLVIGPPTASGLADADGIRAMDVPVEKVDLEDTTTPSDVEEESSAWVWTFDTRIDQTKFNWLQSWSGKPN